MKPGEVSHVESEPGGYVVYRLIDKPTASLDQMKGEIVRELYQQKMELAVKGTLHSVKTEFNDQYFAPPSMPRALPVEGKAPATGTGKHRMQPSRSVKLPPAAEKSAAPAVKQTSIDLQRLQEGQHEQRGSAPAWISCKRNRER